MLQARETAFLSWSLKAALSHLASSRAKGLARGKGVEAGAEAVGADQLRGFELVQVVTPIGGGQKHADETPGAPASAGRPGTAPPPRSAPPPRAGPPSSPLVRFQGKLYKLTPAQPQSARSVQHSVESLEARADAAVNSANVRTPRTPSVQPALTSGARSTQPSRRSPTGPTPALPYPRNASYSRGGGFAMSGAARPASAAASSGGAPDGGTRPFGRQKQPSPARAAPVAEGTQFAQFVASSRIDAVPPIINPRVDAFERSIRRDQAA